MVRCWMLLIVRHYLILEKISYLCLKQSIKTVHHNIYYLNLYWRQRIFSDNDQDVGVLFVIAALINVHEHYFEIYTLLSECDDDINPVKRIKNVYKKYERIMFTFL